MAILTVQNLKAYYIKNMYGVRRTVKAVDDVSIRVNRNKILGIAGESGCGKSTLLKVLTGMVSLPLMIIDGKINYRFEHDDLSLSSTDYSEFKRKRAKYISYIPQTSMSILNPVRKIRKIFYDFINAHYKGKRTDDTERVISAHLTELDLPVDILDAYQHQLSGGMRQRVIIALATILKPEIILADEITTALDVVVQRDIIQLIKKIHEQQKVAIILVTHDLGIHANICSRIAIMYAGKIVEVATVNDIFRNPLHPYTKHLISSLPTLDEKSYKASVPGSPPSLINPPSGCRFHPRCSFAMDVCTKEPPTLTDVGNDHKVACFLNI